MSDLDQLAQKVEAMHEVVTIQQQAAVVRERFTNNLLKRLEEIEVELGVMNKAMHKQTEYQDAANNLGDSRFELEEARYKHLRRANRVLTMLFLFILITVMALGYTVWLPYFVRAIEALSM